MIPPTNSEMFLMRLPLELIFDSLAEEKEAGIVVFIAVYQNEVAAERCRILDGSQRNDRLANTVVCVVLVHGTGHNAGHGRLS